MLLRSAFGAFTAISLVFPPAAQPITPGGPMMISGVEVACTGSGMNAREDARWSEFNLRLEFEGRDGRYQGGETVMLEKDGNILFSVSCGEPWLLAHLPEGRYVVEAFLNGENVVLDANIPALGQARFELRFAAPE